MPNTPAPWPSDGVFIVGQSYTVPNASRDQKVTVSFRRPFDETVRDLALSVAARRSEPRQKRDLTPAIAG